MASGISMGVPQGAWVNGKGVGQDRVGRLQDCVLEGGGVLTASRRHLRFGRRNGNKVGDGKFGPNLDLDVEN